MGEMIEIKIGRWPIVRWIWATVYRRWLDDDERVVRVVNWRAAMIQAGGRRRCMTPCLWWLD
jgi:hypothetical protein